ncbi:hypothetical protein QLH32_17485 [Acinetobacter corruptisaponis]|uniref:Uncharacterized protein n=1 Tax=Acinetobacter corruptisaponis TaxID=3045147 RepID=A0ABY8S2Y6_9GAMM|nr:hypothetical protein [Acinetobacter sp. KCTC 92772]WHP05771.1 hypothetical protein QLH32_17485 [Acinetobacter sp. KCTC 92772]
MSNQNIPVGATHTESDGTFWKTEKNQWFFYDHHFERWRTYVGLVNQNFLDTRRPIMVGEV